MLKFWYWSPWEGGGISTWLLVAWEVAAFTLVYTFEFKFATLTLLF